MVGKNKIVVDRGPILLPWYVLIYLVALAGAFGALGGILILHVFDPFEDRARIELYREDVLDPTPNMPWLQDLARDERQEALR